MTLPVSYTSASLMIVTLPAANSMGTLTENNMLNFAGRAESVVNAHIAKKYVIPPTDTGTPPPLLVTISTDLACYYLLSRRIFTKERRNDSEWPDRFKESLDQLKEIANGDLPLLDVDGVVVSGKSNKAVWSTTDGYRQTFHEGPWVDQVQDPDKIEDLLDDRDL